MALKPLELYFYEQNATHNFLVRRPKKVLFSESSDASRKNMSLSERLAELVRASHGGDAGPLMFTDVRLHAIRQLTEDMITELQDYLVSFAKVQAQPTLPGQVIYDWHADWSDLTELCSYKNAFPRWRTKNGRDGGGGSTQKHSMESSLGGSKKGDGRHGKGGKHQRSSSKMSGTTPKAVTSQRSNSKLGSVNDSKPKLERAASRAGQSTTSTNLNPLKRSPSVASFMNHHQKGSSMGGGGPIPGSRMSRNTFVHSTMGHGANANSGCLVTYQLSSKIFKEKGWTVLEINSEDEEIEKERRVLAALNKSLINIAEVKKINERLELLKPCKLRFYGDRRREQLERYKHTNIKPKKSMFAMCLLRGELPRPLDLRLMFACISNPYININSNAAAQSLQALLNRTLLQPLNSNISAITANDNTNCNTTKTTINATKTSNTHPSLQHSNSFMAPPPPPRPAMAIAAAQSEPMSELEAACAVSSLCISLANFPPPPPLLFSQTSDGTMCVHYPNGRPAIVMANVYGYYMESSQNLNAFNNFTVVNSPHIATLSSMGASSAINLAILVSQNVKNSYTTLIYDNFVRESPLTARHSPRRFLKPLNVDDAAMANEITAAPPPTTTEPNNEQHNGRPSISHANKHPRLLAIITSTGSCICYRANGNPRFVCTETSGLLCNKHGAATYQWKWKELQLIEYEKIRNELCVALNEYIKLEYNNPSSIKLIYSCNKEEVELDLSSVKENQSRIHEMTNRVASDCAFKSKTGQLKISSMSKPTLMQQQTHKSQAGTRKSSTMQSISTEAVNTKKDGTGSASGGANSNIEMSKIDKMLDSTVSYRDIPVMKDLLILQKKIRALLEDWLQYCRTCLNILEPNLYLMSDLSGLKNKSTRYNENHSDFNKIIFYRRKSKSAAETSRTPLADFFLDLKPGFSKTNLPHPTNGSLKATANNEWNYYVYHNVSTANSHMSKFGKKANARRMEIMQSIRELKKELLLQSDQSSPRTEYVDVPIDTDGNSKSKSKTVVWAGVSTTTHGTTMGRISTPTILLKTSSRGSGSADLRHARSRLAQLLFDTEVCLQCPVSLHLRLAFNKSEPTCKCRKYTMPFIKDLEYDFLLEFLPHEQFLVVLVIDSGEHGTLMIQKIIEDIYAEINRNKSQPCKQSMNDEFRFVTYDIHKATDNSDHTQCMLQLRHNVIAGMVLIYQNTNLLFCDNIFNGYGYSEQDFKKQLEQSREDAKLGKYLPFDFRFNHSSGALGKRNVWGGHIDLFETSLTTYDSCYVSVPLINPSGRDSKESRDSKEDVSGDEADVNPSKAFDLKFSASTAVSALPKIKINK